MKHFWINVDKSTERNDFMINQFQKQNIENYRISAITPSHFHEILTQQRPLTCKYPGCTTCEYEFACLCSHIKAMQEGLKQNDEYFVIMEDDIYMPFVIDYEQLLKDIPIDTEILQMMVLHGNTAISLYEHYRSTGNKFIKWKYLLPSTGFYIISRIGAQKLVDKFFNKETHKFDFASSPFQIVADVLLYETAITYTTTLPYVLPYSKLGSEIHPDHIPVHEKSIESIKSVILQHNNKNFPYVKYVS